MRYLLIFATLLASNAFAKEIKQLIPAIELTKSEKQENLSKNEAIYSFKMKNGDESVKDILVIYSIDNNESTVQAKDYKFEIKATPGKHRFIIYLNNEFAEIYSDSLEIKPQFKNTYDLTLSWQSPSMMIEVDKPVIYLYPEEKQVVNIQVEPVGEMSFTYPEYKNGWEVTANTDGTIEHNGNAYNYLFWEAKQVMKVAAVGNNGGFIVTGKNVVSFLEEKLTTVGFTSKEKADFITFWAPRMVQFDKVFVEFIQNEKCDQFAILDIEPKPVNTNRFYMSWGEITTDVNLAPQKLTKMNREGFDVLEWGGQQVLTEEIPESL